jgi:hypothetical protein
LRFSASGYASVTSQSISVGATPTTTTITSDQPDPSRVGDPVTVQFTVTSSAGTPAGTVTVQDGGDSCSGSLSHGQGSCTLQLSTAGDRTLTASYAATDAFAASSDTESHSVQPAPTLTLAVARQPSDTATSGVPFGTQPIVQLQADGNSQALAGVQVTAEIATGSGTLSGSPVTTDASGHATFTDLAITGDAGTRTLVFKASGYADASSTPIDVHAAPPAPPDTSTP